MTQEDKSLLLKDLCARLPYEVKLDNGLKLRSIDALTEVVNCSGSDRKVENVRPYLRPMSSMTKDESFKLGEIMLDLGSSNVMTNIIDFYNAHHLDHHGLIEKGLALEAPEGMYKTE